MNVNDEALKALWSILLSLALLIAGVVCISLGTNTYVGAGVLFLVLYVNSQRE
jgi:hypothetical protein